MNDKSIHKSHCPFTSKKRMRTILKKWHNQLNTFNLRNHQLFPHMVASTFNGMQVSVICMKLPTRIHNKQFMFRIIPCTKH